MITILGGNDFRIILAGLISTGDSVSVMDLSAVEDITIYLTRAGRSKVALSYSLDNYGRAIIPISADDITAGIYGLSFVGTLNNSQLRASDPNVFKIKHGGASGVLRDYEVEMVIATNITPENTYVTVAIDEHNEDGDAHPQLKAEIAAKIADVRVNGESVVKEETDGNGDKNLIADIDLSDYATMEDVQAMEDAVEIKEVAISVDDNIGTPSASVAFNNNRLAFAFQNLLGDGIASVEQTTTSEESEGVNVVTVTTVGGKVFTFQVRNGKKGDTVILGEGVEYTLYNGTGQNTDGAMTQKAVTDAIAADNIPTFGSEKLVKSGGVWYKNFLKGVEEFKVTTTSAWDYKYINIPAGSVISYINFPAASDGIYIGSTFIQRKDLPYTLAADVAHVRAGWTGELIVRLDNKASSIENGRVYYDSLSSDLRDSLANSGALLWEKEVIAYSTYTIKLHEGDVIESISGLTQNEGIYIKNDSVLVTEAMLPYTCDAEINRIKPTVSGTLGISILPKRLADISAGVKNANDGLASVHRTFEENGIEPKSFSAQAYITVNMGITIKAGSIVSISGIPSGGSVYLGFTQYETKYRVRNSNPYIVPVDVTNFRADTAGTYTFKVSRLKQGEVTQDMLNLSSITGLPLSKVGRNLLNLQDPSIVEGKDMYGNGSTYNNADTNITAYIPVKGGGTYCLSSLKKGHPNYIAISIHDYTSAKTHISELKSNVLYDYYVFSVSANAAFVRLSIPKANWSDTCCLQLEEGGSRKAYVPYNPVGGYLLEYGHDVQFFLPSHFYVAEGRTIEIYYDQIVLHAEKYNIKTSCSVGYNLDRKFQITGTNNNVGDYDFTIWVLDDSNNVMAEAKSKIHIVSNNVASGHSILAIGTSLTNDKPWLTEVHNLSENLSIVGKRGTGNYSHEGRSGATVSNYNNNTGSNIYTFDDDYKGTGSDAATFDENASYQAGDFCKKVISTSYGNRTAYYKFVNAHQGAWNVADVYNISMTNPLYDPDNQRVSLNYYKTFQDLDFDAIILELGANGMNTTPETNPNGALGIKTLIDNIREDDANIPIVVVLPIMQSSQNGIGKQGNTDGYSANNDFKFSSDKKHLDLARATWGFIEDYENVYFCPMMECHDSRYNFGNTKVLVNPRLTSTDNVYELQPVDSVHPQNSGYMQMADVIFSTLCKIFGS